MEPVAAPSVGIPANVKKDADQQTQSPEDKTDYSEKSAQKAKFSDYTRVFKYTTLTDRILLGLAVVGQIGYVTSL